MVQVLKNHKQKWTLLANLIKLKGAQVLSRNGQ